MVKMSAQEPVEMIVGLIVARCTDDMNRMAEDLQDQGAPQHHIRMEKIVSMPASISCERRGPPSSSGST